MFIMKKLSGLFGMIFLLVGSLGFVVAEDGEDVVPEAKKVSFFENFRYRIDLVFTFNKEKKIEKILEMAEKRLAEAELLAEENSEAYTKAQERYDALVSRAEEILAGIEEGGDGVNGSLGDVERVFRIQDKFERHRAHADEIYTRVLEKFEANNASDEKIARFEMFYERTLNKSYKMEVRILEKRENAIRKYKNLSNGDDDEVNEVLKEIEDREGLNKFREERMERAEDRIRRIVGVKMRYIGKTRLRLNDSNLNEERKAEIEMRIESAEGNLERFEFRFREKIEDGEIRSEIRFREKVENRFEEEAVKEVEENLLNEFQ